jgi:hypothetical protein
MLVCILVFQIHLVLKLCSCAFVLDFSYACVHIFKVKLQLKIIVFKDFYFVHKFLLCCIFFYIMTFSFYPLIKLCIMQLKGQWWIVSLLPSLLLKVETLPLLWFFFVKFVGCNLNFESHCFVLCVFLKFIF